jgi:hypothetical protein
MNKIWILVLVVGIIAVGFWVWPKGDKVPQNNTQTPVVTDIQVSQPAANATISSPLAISGQAVGGWYFEASFPIKLYNSSNVLIGQTTAQAQSDWMTTNLVPFTASLTFSPQTTGSVGTLVFEKDNPSGEAANAGSYSVNVIF